MSPLRLYLIRHGQPNAGFADAIDPGLNETGKAQAQAVATELSMLGPLPIVTSPLTRARETAIPFERQWNTSAQVEVRVAEIPSPSENLQERTAWLSRIIRGGWSDLPSEYLTWKEQLVNFLVTRQTSTLLTTHFIAINVAVGTATADDRLVCFEPDHCSCTVLEVVEGTLRIVSLGRQRATLIR